MIVKPLTEHQPKGDCTGSSESTHVNKPHCWKSHVKAHITFIIANRENLDDMLYVAASPVSSLLADNKINV